MLHTLLRLRAPHAILLALSIIVFLIAIILLSGDVRTKIARLASANTDNVQWTLSQIEVEFLHIERAIHEIQDGRGELDRLREKFDIFYTRFDTIKSSQIYASLHTSPGADEHIQHISEFLEQSIPLIDGDDETLRNALNDMLLQMAAIEQDIRELPINGIIVFSEAASNEREQVAITLLRLAATTTALILLLLGVLAFLVRAVRIGEERAQNLNDTSQRLRTIIATSLDAVLMVDEEGQLLTVGGAAATLFGRPEQELLKLRANDLIMYDGQSSDDGLSCKRHINKLLGAGQAGTRKRSMQAIGLRPDGVTFPADLSIAEASSSNGMVIVMFLRDISKRLQNEQALTAARDEALVAARSKAEFLAVMSHEMRTPLGGLLGSMENLRHTGLSSEQSEWLDIMTASGQILTDHVNDVLDIAKLEAGKIEFVSEPVDIGALLDQLTKSQMSQAEQRNNQLVLKLPDQYPRALLTNPPRLRQVMLNLLGNAIKFTKDGTIEVGFDVDDDQANMVAVKLYVSDTGIGIAENKQADIFNDFVTLDSAYSRANSGTGLGLGIVRRLVTAMGGKIALESQEGKGSRFTIHLSLPRSDANEPQLSDATQQAPSTHQEVKRLLLVEDNHINRKVLARQIENLGHEVEEAFDGLDAESKALTGRFDLILMDISMPRQDGIQTTANIRRRGKNKHTPILALTAHALPEEKQRFKDVGMQATLTKPISSADLLTTIKQWGGHKFEPIEQHSQYTRTGALTGDRLTPPTVLLIDEDHLSKMHEELGDTLFDRLRNAACEDGNRLCAELTHLAHTPLAGEVAHKLAGTAASFGAKRLHATIAEAEAILRDHSTAPDDRQELIDVIISTWQETHPLLESKAYT